MHTLYNLSNILTRCFCKNHSKVQGRSKYKRRIKKPPISRWNSVCLTKKKTEWKTMALAEMTDCSWQGQMEAGIYGHAGPNGSSLLIDHFQLRADLQVNMERFHQVLEFRHKWKSVCTHPFDGNDPTLSALWARGRMCSWEKQLPRSSAWICPRGGSILQTTSVTIH